MLDIKNTYLEYLSLQKVGHKVREEKLIFATEVTPVDERKEEDLIPFLLAPFRKKLEVRQFSHYTGKLEFNKIHELATSMFNEEIDFVDFSNDVLQSLYDCSLHPQIKSGEVFIVQFNNVMFDDIPCKAIGIYKLENKKKFIRFDERNTIDYDVLKGYKLDKIDKACLILDVYRDEGFRVFSVDDRHQESEFWTKNFLEVSEVVNPILRTKQFIQSIEDYSVEILNQSDKKQQADFIENTLISLSQNDRVDAEVLDETLGEHKADFENYLKQNEIEIEKFFEVDFPTVVSQAKKIKTEMKLDTGAKINLDLQVPGCATECLERGYDEEKKMYFYKVYFNSEN